MAANGRAPRGKPASEIGAVIYCRVSTKEQVQNLSLETQRRACVKFCQSAGWAVRQVFVEEGESAKTTKRPKLLELLRYCRENKGTIQHLIVYRVDRFSRNNHDHALLAAHLKQLGVTLRSATEPIGDSSTEKLMENMLSAFAQFDNDVRSERTIAGMKAAMEEGRWTFGVPLGYRRIIDGAGRKNIEPDPASASLIREAFERYGKGTETKADVLREMTALGLRTRKGKPLTMQTFQKTLRNPIYAAVLRMPSWEIDGVPGNFEAIVPEELFERVQAVLDGKTISVTPHTRNHADFPLRRFARCAHCDTPLTGSWSKGRNRKYAYYRCRNAGCHAVKVGKDAFEGRFLDFLTGLRPKPEYVRLFREVVLDVWNAKRAEAKAGRVRLSRRIEDLEERRQKLVEAYLYRGGIDDTVYRRQDDKLAEEIALVRTELHDEELAEIDVEGVLNFAEVLMIDTRRLWIEGTLAQRQRLQKVLFPAGVTFDQKNGFGTAETASFFRWLAAVPSSENREATPTGFEPQLGCDQGTKE
jgi:DNA invertase Pin-like site-specific DNA recombinase